jgi:protein-disulfide isomerase
MVLITSMFKTMFMSWAIIGVGGLFYLLLSPFSAASQNKSSNEVSLGSGPSLGSTSAPVTIIEFSDFQCSFCKKFWADTLPKLKEAYINTGKARFGYRHDQLFKNQGGLAFTETKLKQYARDIGLNVGVFGTCLETGKHRQKVERETEAAANLGGRGTPLFIVNQRPLVGAQPYSVFQKMIDEELASQEAKKKIK